MYASYTVCILNTIQKNALKLKPVPALASSTPAKLLRLFLQLLPHRALLKLPALKNLTFYDRLFTPLVTLWYLLFQRLHTDSTLDRVVENARKGGANRLNRKLSRQLKSESTASYSDARQRLPWQFLSQALRLQGQQICQQSPTTLWQGMILDLLDGSTVGLRPYQEVKEEFAPHGNQHRQGAYWCLMRVVVSFCCFSGAVLDCALGSTHLSEQALGVEIMLRAVGNHLFLGDRNFGVFRIVQVARHCSQQVLLRMTEARAAKLLGQPLDYGDYAVSWKASRHDRLEPGLSKDPVPGRLIVARVRRAGFRSQRLCLFTTLTDPVKFPPEQLVQLYGLRWHVELDLRYIKTQMDSAQLEVKSAQMARKEWLASLLAYNLLRAAMLCAALQQGIPPLTLSFSAARRRLESWLQDFGRTKADVLASWQRTLARIAKCRLPKRRRNRPSEPRAKRRLPQSFPPLIGSRAQARKKLHQRPTKS